MTKTNEDHEWDLLRELDPLPDHRSPALMEISHRSDLFSTIIETDLHGRRNSPRRGARAGRRSRKVWAVLAASSTVLTGGSIAAVVLLTSTAAPAFAGWSAVPTAATPAALSAATAACNWEWNHDSPSTMSSAQAVLSETRGNYTAAIYLTASDVYACVTAGAKDSTQVTRYALPSGQSDASGNNNTQPGPEQISAPIGGGGSAPGFPGGNPNGPLPERWQRALATITNPTQRAQQEQAWRNVLARGVEYDNLGLAGSDVSAVTLSFADGLTVNATVENGWYFAWWPTPDPPTSMQITTSSGATTATLGPLGGAECEASPGCIFSNQIG